MTFEAASRQQERTHPPARPARGFTLLEVMIALAILSVSLVALAGINIGAMNMHAYSKRLTIATLLARSKIADVESELQSEGLPVDDEIEDGTFEEEGFPEYRWQAEIIRPRTEDVSVDELLAMTGMGLDGQDGAGALGGLSGMLGGGQLPDGASASALAAGGADLLGGAMQSQIQRLLDDFGQTMREVRVTVSWPDGDRVEQFTVVTHVVSLGAGTDQATSDPNAAGNNRDVADSISRGLPQIPGYGSPPNRGQGIQAPSLRTPFLPGNRGAGPGRPRPGVLR